MQRGCETRCHTLLHHICPGLIDVAVAKQLREERVNSVYNSRLQSITGVKTGVTAPPQSRAKRNGCAHAHLVTC